MEQHFLRQTDGFDALLSQCQLVGRSVLEIGVGEGDLTQVILRHGGQVKGYELDTSLGRHLSDIVYADITKVPLGFLSKDWACISAPPYSLLPWILDLLDRYEMHDAILMTSAKKQPLLEARGFKTVFALTGEDFYPPAEGLHYVMQRGFKK